MEIIIKIGNGEAKAITEVDGNKIEFGWKKTNQGTWRKFGDELEDMDFLSYEQYEALDGIPLIDLQEHFDYTNFEYKDEE